MVIIVYGRWFGKPADDELGIMNYELWAMCFVSCVLCYVVGWTNSGFYGKIWHSCYHSVCQVGGHYVVHLCI
ncbi:MAG: hypothetical protein HZC26_02005 [Candidatus Magasanikbacteria bacterium]|nr:hypothetical protein [Candidatus Magasanikbacteria bacterium]